MRAKAAKDGLTLRAIAGVNSVLLAFDLNDVLRPHCLGFSVERTDMDTGKRRWLPNMLRFSSDICAAGPTTARAPLQAFRWGDYTTGPGKHYAYRLVARSGTAADVIKEGTAAEKGGNIDGGVTVEVRTENNAAPATAVFFNRGAAASKAYNDKFGTIDPGKDPAALTWLSRGLEEALLAFLAQATDREWGLHAVVYEFQKPNLLAALRAAKERGADVQVVYHARVKGAAEHAEDQHARQEHGAANSANDADADDKTAVKNLAAIQEADLGKVLGDDLRPRRAPPPSAIMHDKYVVLLQGGEPVAVWTGSTNWTEGGIYGQLNVGHAVYEPAVAARYEQSFQLLRRDPSAGETKSANAEISSVPAGRAAIPLGVTPVFSPQANSAMIDRYAEICSRAKLLLVSAPFLLHPKIRAALEEPSDGALRYVMADKAGSFGTKGEVELFNGVPGNVGVAATMLKTALNDFQGKLLEGHESFHHAGVHVHSKIILADPFGTDPILVTGSANFSQNSTIVNDSNSLIVRGDSAVADIYATEFMRMFQHYWFRYRQDSSRDAVGSPKPDSVLALKETDVWQAPYFEAGNTLCRDRLAFIG